MTRRHMATERLSPEAAHQLLKETHLHVEKILQRLRRIAHIPPEAKILDVGAAQGLVLICCQQRGLNPVGVEPWPPARRAAVELARREGVEIKILPGTAEALPLPDEQFHIVHANSVIEHVLDPAKAFKEAHRVLKPGGVFWFSASNSLCPRQSEIALFPCFSWYPNRLKRAIMQWARQHKPHLIGHTSTPALNWFTPRKARRMLLDAGFTKIYDRWDLRLPEEGGRIHRFALGIIRLCSMTKLMAEVLVPACSYAAVKAGGIIVTQPEGLEQRQEQNSRTTRTALG